MLHTPFFQRRSFRGALALALALAAAPFGWSVETIGHGRLTGSTTLRADYDSNIFVNSSQVEDFIGMATGELRYSRDASVVTLDLAAGFNALGFADHTDQNGFEPYLNAKWGYQPSGKTDAQASLNFRRSTVANETVNDRTKSNDYSFDGQVQHLTTDKLGFRVTAQFSQSTNLTTGYSDTERGNIGVHGVHVYSPKLKLLAGVTAGLANSTGETGRIKIKGDDIRYTVGAEGDFASKIKGTISAGYVERKFDRASMGNAGTLYLMNRISWQAAEKTTWSLVMNRDFGVSAGDQSIRSTQFTVELWHQLSEKLTFEGSAGWDQSDYSAPPSTGSRKDDGYVARGRLVYTLRENASLEFSAGYRDNDSSLATSTYDRINAGAAFMFRF
jgi:hypothetical protein